MFKFSMSQLIFRIPQDVRLDSLNSRCFRLILWPSPRSWSRKWFPCVFFINTNPHSVASMEPGLQSTKTNTQTDRLRLQSGLFHFGNRPFCPSFLVLTLFPPVYVVLVVFTSLLFHIQMGSLCLFVLSKRQNQSFDLRFQFLRSLQKQLPIKFSHPCCLEITRS